MAHPLQYRQAAQRIGLPPACARKHRSDGPEAYDALTIKPDHPMGAGHPLLGLLDLRPSGEGIASPGIYSLPAGEGFTAYVAHSMVCGRWPDGSRNSAVDPGAVAGCGFTGNCEGHVVIGENVYEYFGHPPYVRNDGDQWVLVFPRSHWLVDEIAVIVDGQLIFDPQPALQSE